MRHERVGRFQYGIRDRREIRHKILSSLQEMHLHSTTMWNCKHMEPCVSQENAKALAAAGQEWEQLALGLVSCEQMVTPASIDEQTGRCGFLPAFADVMHQARFLGRFEDFLHEYPPLPCPFLFQQ